jgi:inorganic pyrophosphatase
MKSLSNFTRLKPLEKKDGLVQVIIETRAGSRNKFAFNPDQIVFVMKKVLPAGMVFPYDFKDFFVNYHGLERKKYKLPGCKGQEVALGLIKKAHKAV